jgi:hypothetical protein
MLSYEVAFKCNDPWVEFQNIKIDVLQKIEFCLKISRPSH